MNEWDGRAEYYRASWSHAAGDDLDQLVAWCEPVRVWRRWTWPPAGATWRAACATKAAS